MGSVIGKESLGQNEDTDRSDREAHGYYDATQYSGSAGSDDADGASEHLLVSSLKKALPLVEDLIHTIEPPVKKQSERVSKEALLDKITAKGRQRLIDRCDNRLRILLECIAKNAIVHDLDVYELQALLVTSEFDLIPDSSRDHFLINAAMYVSKLSSGFNFKSNSQNPVLLLYIKTLAIVLRKISETDSIQDLNARSKKNLESCLALFEKNIPKGPAFAAMHYYLLFARQALDSLSEPEEHGLIAQFHRVQLVMKGANSVLDGFHESMALVSDVLSLNVPSLFSKFKSGFKGVHKVEDGLNMLYEALNEEGDAHAWFIIHGFLAGLVEAYAYKKQMNPEGNFSADEEQLIDALNLAYALEDSTKDNWQDAFGRLELCEQFMKVAGDSVRDQVFEVLEDVELEELHERLHFKLATLFPRDFKVSGASKHRETYGSYQDRMADQLEERRKEQISKEERVLDNQKRFFNARYREDLQSYIPVRCQAGPQSEQDELFQDKLDDFLRSDRSVLLVLGDAGGGKTSTARHYAYQLMREFDYGDAFFPVYIFLGESGLNPQTCVDDALARAGASVGKMASIRQKYSVIIFLDAIDESRFNNQEPVNLFVANRLREWARVKVIMTCRQQYFNAIGQNLQLFHGQKADGEVDRATVTYIKPFDDSQINSYVDQFCRTLKTKKGNSTPEEYLSRIKKMPGLGGKLRIPMVLKIVLTVLWDLPEHKTINRMDLYEAFVKQWMGREKQELKQDLGYSILSEVESDFILYASELAYGMTCEGTVRAFGGKNVPALASQQQMRWENFFIANDRRTLAKRLNCPIKRMGEGEYGFVHKTFQDYFTALLLLENLKTVLKLKFRINPKALKLDSLETEEGRIRTWIKDEPVVLEMLGELLVADKEACDLALMLIHATRKQPKLEAAASAVATALNYGRFNFRGLDLSYARLAEADLSSNNYEGTNFEGAHLVNVKFRDSFLGHTNFNKAHMEGVDFGRHVSIPLVSNVSCVAISPKSDWIAVSNLDGNVRTFGMDGIERHVFKGHKDWVLCVAIAASGKFVVSGSRDKTIRVWSVDGQERYVLNGEKGVSCLAIAHSSQWFVSGDWSNDIRIWSADGKELQVLTGHTKNASAIAIAPSDEWFLSRSADGTIRLWGADGQKRRVFAIPDKYGLIDNHSLAINPSSEWFAFGVGLSDDSTKIRIWDLNGQEKRVLVGHKFQISSIAISPLNDFIVSGSEDKTIRIWGVDGQEISVLKLHGNEVRSVAIDLQSEYIVSGGADRTIQIFKTALKEQHLKRSLGPEKSVRAVCISPLGTHIISATFDNNIRIFDVDGREQAIAYGHTESIYVLEFSPSGQWFVSGGLSGRVYKWGLDGEQQQSFYIGYTSVTSIAIPASEDLMVVGTYDKTVQIWKMDAQEATVVLRGHTDSVKGLGIAPSGKWIASGSNDGVICLWEINGNLRATIKPQAYSGIFRVTGISISPSETWLAVSSYDQTIRILNTQGKELHILEHGGYVMSVKISQSGKWLASGGYDNSVCLWDTSKWTCLSKIHFHGNIGSISISQNRFLAFVCNSATFFMEIDDNKNKPKDLGLAYSSDYSFFARGAKIKKATLSGTNRRLLLQEDATEKRKWAPPREDKKEDDTESVSSLFCWRKKA